MHTSLLFLLMVLWSNNFSASGTPLQIRAPSVFRSDEADMHRYSAILAATEPFRIQADEAIKSAIGPYKYILTKVQGKSLMNAAATLRSTNKEVDMAYKKYESRVESTLRSYGMTAASFNDISTSIQRIPQTKSRVLLQAYYYKIAADLQANLLPSMPVLPSIAKEPSSKYSPAKLPHPDSEISMGSANPAGLDGPGIVANEPESKEISRLTRFCSALKAIEHERLRHRDYIKNELKIDRLPSKMTDPDFLPAMSPVIQRASANFPKVAAIILGKYQMPVEEFNAMQVRVDKDPLFRMRVNREIKRLGSTR